MSKKSNIYTKGGDRGETSLLGGKRVPKYHIRIEAYGTVDELMAHTALLRDMSADAPEEIRAELLVILDVLMRAASLLAADCDDCRDRLPVITEEQVAYLEKAIDRMDEELEPLTSFILPGGHPVVSQAHVARTVCRRAERAILRLAAEEEVEEILLRFFNRLSDYYFVLSRELAYIFKVKQIPW